ncbi:rod shape-determining protein MreC [Sphaerisporangium sp. TRM90804]|uniref:rod shape-determining protein MreC n=1 Tax=Sphaerisporangium sp. TRM90804 TaxID=3031113 RepID=UPI002446E71F|nr:rod shape-determining protein MreC [Sphaerisporangium sp. TRM90804]MDH2428121.1 rod shape-determining protein MreC [Sphaerisporangium sp. TRM90804]
MRDTRRGRLILGVLLAAALVLITIDHRQRGDSLLGPLHTAGSSVFGVAERAGTAVVSPVGDFFHTFASAPEAKRRIEALRAENARLRSDLAARTLDRQRSAELSRTLGLSGLGGYRVVPAQVIARRGAPGFEDAVEIDAGSGDGVRSEMTVLNGDGLVGRVVRAGPSSSTVVLLTDPASSAGGRVEGTNEIGVVTGLGVPAQGRFVRFRLLDSTVSLAVGRRLVSFGSQNGMPYAPGLPIGVVQRVEATPGELTRVAYAKPFVDFTALDVVGVVVRAPQRDPRDSMLPPPPPAAARARATAPPAPRAGSPSPSPGAASDSGSPPPRRGQGRAPRDDERPGTPPVRPAPARGRDDGDEPAGARDGGRARDGTGDDRDERKRDQAGERT